MIKRAKKPKRVTVRQWLKSLGACDEAVNALGNCSLKTLKRRWDAGEIDGPWACWILDTLMASRSLRRIDHWDVQRNIDFDTTNCPDGRCPRCLFYTQYPSDLIDHLLPEGLE